MPRAPEKPIPALRPIREKILAERYPEEEARNFDNIAQLRAMDKEGLDVAILYPSRGLFVLAIDGLDPELGAAIELAVRESRAGCALVEELEALLARATPDSEPYSAELLPTEDGLLRIKAVERRLYPATIAAFGS